MPAPPSGAPSPVRTPVLVLGAGLTALGVVRTLGRAGIPSFVLAPRPDMEGWSRWYQPAPPPAVDVGLAPADYIPAYLEATPLRSAVLLPCGDAPARACADLPPSLSERFPASVAAAEVLDLLVDKARFSRALEEHGVPHPRSWRVDGPDDLDMVPADALEGVFIKPRDSVTFFARFGVKAFRPRGPEEIRRRLADLARSAVPVIVQEYVPGPPRNHYFIDGFVDRDGVVRAVFVRRRERMYPPDFGNSSAMVSVPPDEAATAVEALTRFLGRIGYRGIFSAEFKKDAEDGVFRLLEINARAWWYVEFAARCGVDVVSMGVRDALEMPVESVEHYAVGRRLVYPYYDRYAAPPGSGLGGRIRLFASWIGAQQPVFVLDDPIPVLRETAAWLGHSISARLPGRRSGAEAPA